MATTPLKYLHQYFTTTLNVGGGLDNSQTTGIVIQAVSGLDIAKPGVACLTYADPINTSTAEWITYTSIDGSNELQGVVRGAEGFGAKTHSNGAVVAFPLSESHINNLNAMFDSTGADFAQIATPANPDSGRNKIYPKSDGKFYTLTSAGAEVGLATESYVSTAVATDGWTASADTWTYASASTITVPSGAASIYQVGDRIKWTQTTVKYGVIVTVADTLLTIAVNTDYTVANAAITLPYYSHQESPLGYPGWFVYTPTWSGTGGSPSISNGSIQGRFSVNGKNCRFEAKLIWGASTTANSATENRLSLPITSATLLTGTAINPIGATSVYDSGSSKIYVGVTSHMDTAKAGSYIEGTAGSTSVGHLVPMTWASGDVWSMSGDYPLA